MVIVYWIMAISITVMATLNPGVNLFGVLRLSPDQWLIALAIPYVLIILKARFNGPVTAVTGFMVGWTCAATAAALAIRGVNVGEPKEILVQMWPKLAIIIANQLFSLFSYALIRSIAPFVPDSPEMKEANAMVELSKELLKNMTACKNAMASMADSYLTIDKSIISIGMNLPTIDRGLSAQATAGLNAVASFTVAMEKHGASAAHNMNELGLGLTTFSTGVGDTTRDIQSLGQAVQRNAKLINPIFPGPVRGPSNEGVN